MVALAAAATAANTATNATNATNASAKAASATAAHAATTQDPRRSGFDPMSAATQAMQRDDALNPAMLCVMDGRARWSAREAGASRACENCHGDAASPVRGAAARHPAWNETAGRPVTLAQRINACRERRQGLPPLAPESEGLQALQAWVGLQSRGLPMAPPSDPRLAPATEQGRTL
jgi:sulfur-oxidizing protein SoxA